MSHWLARWNFAWHLAPCLPNVLGAFMQTDMDELVHVRFTDKMVELFLEIDEAMYKRCITLERGERVMYVELLKALYGTIRPAGLFWEKLLGR